MSTSSSGVGLSRAFDCVLASAGLILSSPLLLIAAVLITVTSPGPVLFRQERVGRLGAPFTLLKLRTMRAHNGGRQVTAGGDSRVTLIGRLLRKSKIDELPGLWNVLRGDLCLVGPRPEVPRYVDILDPVWKEVLDATPGITDPVTLILRNEEELLSICPGDPEVFYIKVLQRYKLLGYSRYLCTRTWWSDLSVLLASLRAVILPARAKLPTLDEIAQAVEFTKAHQSQHLPDTQMHVETITQPKAGS